MSLPPSYSKLRSYRSWYDMKRRCTNSRCSSFKFYGEKGINYCSEWENFENFFEDMGECPPGFTIDRIDNEKGYFKENCRWADKETQFKNKRPRKHSREFPKRFSCSKRNSSSRYKTGMIEKFMSIYGNDIKSLADSLGVSIKTVYAWLSGRNRPSVAMAIRIERMTKGLFTVGDIRPDVDGS